MLRRGRGIGASKARPAVGMEAPRLGESARSPRSITASAPCASASAPRSNGRMLLPSALNWPTRRLPPDRKLAARYGLARNTVRSAMDRIAPELIRVVGRGTYVRAKGRGSLPGVGSHMGDASPAEVMEVRLIIEPQAAALAAHRANSDDLAEIEETLKK